MDFLFTQAILSDKGNSFFLSMKFNDLRKISTEYSEFNKNTS